MSAAELNFKKMSTEKYRVYRLLQSPSSLIQTYRDRIKVIGKYKGAIIFPEQFIALYGQAIYRVAIRRTSINISTSAALIESFCLCDDDTRDELFTFDDVLRVEKEAMHQTDAGRLFRLRLSRPKGSSTSFTSNDFELKQNDESPSYWFSNKADALNFMRNNCSFT